MEAATASHFALAARISDRWPSCNAPMVGTNPKRFPECRAVREVARISSIVLQIFMARSQEDGTQFISTCMLSNDPATKARFLRSVAWS